MAPEVADSGNNDSDHYDFKADSWSMGVTLFFMWVEILYMKSQFVDELKSASMTGWVENCPLEKGTKTAW
jgi:hypothetical protein